MPGRCFLALDLPPAHVERLKDARRAFVDAAHAWAGEKWVRDDLLHQTIKFIGPLPDEAVPDALAGLSEACVALARPVLRLETIRAVPSERRARMLWATLDDAGGACAQCAAVIDKVLSSRFGVPVEERPFAAHVTLVRARAPRPVPADALHAARACLEAVSGTDSAMSVRVLRLYSSTLGPGGPRYEALGEVPVGVD